MSSRQLRLRGPVQGVGFRPYVWRLTNELGLRGWVNNDAAGVLLAVDGATTAEFIRRLPLEPPPLARIVRSMAASACSCPAKPCPGARRSPATRFCSPGRSAIMAWPS